MNHYPANMKFFTRNIKGLMNFSVEHMVVQEGNPVADNSMKDLEVETGWIVLVLDHYVTLVMKTKDH